MDKLFTEITEWQRETFRNANNPVPALKHLQKEVVELISDPSDPLEYADCLFLLFDAAQRVGLTYDDLVVAVAQKFEINKARKWGAPDADGVMEHVE